MELRVLIPSREDEKWLAFCAQHGLELTHGDLRLEWNPDNDVQVATAKAAFDEAKKRGMRIFREDEEGKRGGEITTFQKDARRLVAIPQIRGGAR